MRINSVACSISYSMIPIQVTCDLSRDPLEPIVQIPSDTDTDYPGPFIERYLASEFSNRLNRDADEARFIVGNYIIKGKDEFMPDIFVQMMSLVANMLAAELLGDPATMFSAATTAFTYTGVQVANKYLLTEII